MIYIYDILLNFNDKLIEYFEWEEKDNIKYVKKIAVFKAQENIINDIIKKELLLSNDFTEKIPKYEMNGLKKERCACLLTDGNIVIGILIKENKIIGISRLLLDEENEVLDISSNLKPINISYKILNNKINYINNLTRKEQIIKEKLTTEFKNLFINKQYNKLYYLYYEYTNKESKNYEYIYNYLINTLTNFNNKHLKLNEILLLSNKKN